MSFVACGGDSDSAADAGTTDGSVGGLVDATVATPDARPEITYEGNVVDVQMGGTHVCALLDGGKVRCWGANEFGQLGYGHVENGGDDETAAAAGDVDVGGGVTQLALGFHHTCALLDTKRVRCWGRNDHRELGYDHLDGIGDTEAPSSAGDVDLGGDVAAISAGWYFTCALLETGAVKCWGDGTGGVLGNATEERVGLPPHMLDEIDLGGPVRQIASGQRHTCVQLEAGGVRCWGAGINGGLGYGNGEDIGDNELASAVGLVDVGGTSPVVSLAAGYRTTCAVLENQSLRCWGVSRGNGNAEAAHIGDNELPSEAEDVDVGADVVSVSAGSGDEPVTCALVAGGNVRCWGVGVRGYGGLEPLSNRPSDYGDLDIGYPVRAVRAGYYDTCVLLERGSVRCWGSGGLLGTGPSPGIIGDDEPLTSMRDACIEGFEESCF